MSKILYKKENTVFMAILIIILEVTLSRSTPYSKSVLPVYPLSNVIWSSIMFIVFFFVFSGFVVFNFTNLRICQCKIQILKSFFISLLLRIALDLICLIFLNSEIKTFISMITDYVFYIIFFRIIVYFYTSNNMLRDMLNGIIKKDKTVIITTSIFIFSFIVSVTFIFINLFELWSYTEKYTADSQFYLFQSMCYSHKLQIFRTITSIISEVVIILILNVLYGKSYKDKLPKANKIVYIFTRSVVSIALVFVLYFVKLCFFSTGSIDKISTETSDGYIGWTDITSDSFTNKQIYRKINFSKVMLSYEKTDVEIKYQHDYLQKFVLNNYFDDEYPYADKNKISRKSSGASVDIGEQEVVFYSNQYIAFAKNDIPYVIAFDDIKSHEENAVLTSFLEYMVSCGYWNYFEYGCDYLLKYEPNFIKPYIERYANNNFTDDELVINNDIKTEYMVNFSKQYVE